MNGMDWRRAARTLASGAVLAACLAACTTAGTGSATSSGTGEPAPGTGTGASAATSPGASATAAPGGGAVLEMPRLSASAAVRAAEAALARCEDDGLPFVAVAVVDRFGQFHALVRGDNAAEHTIETARRKAYTAAAFGANTSELAERAQGEGATIRDIPGTIFLGGGVAVRAGERPIAGIGVGGAPSGEADEACAQAGLDAISDSLSG